MNPSIPPSFVHVLRTWAQDYPDQLACAFLDENGAEDARLTYQQLDERARVCASWLQEVGLTGERVLLLLQPGLDYLIAYLGCLYAGAIAVPAYPPDESRLERSLPRALAIANSAGVKAVFTDTALMAQREAIARLVPPLGELLWMLVPAHGSAGSWVPPSIEASSLAFLQYTSGSTGVPKGVMITHGALVHNAWAMRERMQQGPGARMVSWVPPYHDMGLVVGILMPLFARFPTYLLTPATFVRSPFRWLEAISRHQATTSCAPNFAFELCLRKVSSEQRSLLDLSPWTLALNGAEPVRAQTIENFTRVFAPCGFRRETFYPAFGMSDATAMVSGGPKLRPPPIFHADPESLRLGLALGVDASSGQPLVSCGPVIDGQEALIVDPATRQVLLDGQVGELWLRGPCVGLGYWNHPVATAETFGARLADETGPFLRTGDLAFKHQEDLYPTGRLKDLIIVRGKNHYPQDIESTVQATDPSMRAGCGIAFALDVDGEERLVVIQEFDDRGQAVPADLLERVLRQIVSEHELSPYALLLVSPGSIPKTSSGKLQRSACRQLFLENRFVPVYSYRAESEAREHPLSTKAMRSGAEREKLTSLPVEQQHHRLRLALLGHIAAVLRVDPLQITPHKPLNAMGVDSLSAIELRNRLELTYEVHLSMVDILQGITLKDLAQEIVLQLQQARPSDRGLNGLEARQVFPLSHGQQALWFLHQLAPDSGAYNVVMPIRLRGGLEVERLLWCFQMLSERHSLLRASFFAEEGTPYQRTDTGRGIEVELVSGEAWSESALRDFLAQRSHLPFSLEGGTLMRAHLIRRGDDDHVLLLVAHHIVIDFWSLGVFFYELRRLYTTPPGAPSPLLPLDLDYSQYVDWQRRTVESNGQQDLDFWRQRLSGVAALELPTDRPRPAQQSYRGAAFSLALTTEQTRALKQLADAQGSTLFVLLMTVYQLLLHLHTGQPDIAIGTLSAGRTRAELADIMGYFVNPLVIRTQFDGGTFVELLGRVRDSFLEALQHQNYPFSLLVERLLASRDPSRSPLFQALFVLQRAPSLDDNDLTPFALQDSGAQSTMGDLVLESVAVEQRAARFDLSLTMVEGPAGLVGSIEYNADLFDPPTIERLARRFSTLVDSIVARPETPLIRLAWLPPGERALVLDRWNDTRRDVPALTIPQLFERQVDRIPDQAAVTFEGQTLCYADLDRLANRVAHALLTRGCERGERVALCVDRGLALAVGILGILKAGCAYVPLDPTYPVDRLQFMLGDSGARLMVTQSEILDRVPLVIGQTLRLDDLASLLPDLPDTRSAVALEPRDLAYVLYTSGSTGLPKGVMIEHRSVVNFLGSMAEAPGLREGEALLSVTSPSFDIFGLELFLPLVQGGRLVLVARSTAVDGAALDRLLVEHDIAVMQATPTTWQLLLEGGGITRPGLRALCGGEPLPRSLAAALLGRVGELWNMYGPTETTIWSTCQRVESADRITLGRPIANTRVYVLDEQQQPVAVGVFGEGYIAGAGVARGYFQRDELTASRFVPDPFAPTPGERMYRTGDRMRWLPEGELEFAGRTDFQVKLRGYRIELGEIEARLGEITEISRAIVHVVEVEPQLPQLVAYIVPVPGMVLRHREILKQLRESLPEYMVPQSLVELEAFPLTPNGKINRKALPLPRPRAASDIPESMRSTTESRLAQIWSVLLGVGYPRENEDFFELGGHSLLVIRLIAQLRRVFGVECPVADIFRAPTMREMTQLVERLQQRSSSLVPETNQPDLEGDITLDESIQGPGSRPSIPVDSELVAAGPSSRQVFATTPPSRSSISVESLAEPLSLSESPPPGSISPEALVRRLVSPARPSSSPRDLNSPVAPPRRTESMAAESPTAPLFFTGGTGFLGAFLLRELLDRCSWPIHTLVRARSAAEGLQRLRANLDKFSLWRDEFADRIVPVTGDLNKPRFGLSEDQFGQLATDIRGILHNGALVDFVQPYSLLRGANVAGTQEIFRLAARGDGKPVHFVSTVSVFPPQVGERRRESEDSDLQFDGSRIHGGYAQSKWVSDRIALIARSRGIPVTIYRPGSILGSSTGGQGNLDDIFHLIVKGCVQLGQVPDVDMWANFTPTDFVAPAIAALMLDPASQGGTYHLVNPLPVPWTTLCDVMRELGYDVELVPYERWLGSIEQAVEQSPDNALVRVLPFFQVPRETFRLPWFDDQRARTHLAPHGVRCAPADHEFLETWLRRLIDSGFLPKPPSTS